MQIIENQVRLELLCKFTFEKDEKKLKYRKVYADGLK
jgi:hypothetical protein